MSFLSLSFSGNGTEFSRESVKSGLFGPKSTGPGASVGFQALPGISKVTLGKCLPFLRGILLSNEDSGLKMG